MSRSMGQMNQDNEEDRDLIDLDEICEKGCIVEGRGREFLKLRNNNSFQIV